MNESLAFGCKWRGQGSKQRHNQKQPDKFLRSFKDMRQQTMKNAAPRLCIVYCDSLVCDWKNAFCIQNFLPVYSFVF